MNASQNQEQSTITAESGRADRFRGRAARHSLRLLAASAVVVLGGAAVSTSVSAAPAPPGDDSNSIEGEIPEHNPAKPPAKVVPDYRMPSAGDIPSVGDLLPENIRDGVLPEGYEFPDDDADPEPCDGPCEDGGPHEGDEPGEDLGEDYEGDYPYDCGPDELVECPDDGEEQYDCPLTHYDPECEQPDETTTTSTTVVTSTTSTTLYELEKVDVQEKAEERKGDTLAFTGSNGWLPLAGAGVLAAGVLVAGLAVAARKRDEADGEPMGQA